MKKIILGFFIVILISGFTLWTQGKDMREIRTEIEIAAPPAKVWSVLTNIEQWKDWSPIINQSSGTASMGNKLNITMCGEDGKKGKAGPNYEPVITSFEESKNLTWTATMMAGFIMTNGKVLELEETSTGTRLIHKETFSGLMVPMMWGKVQENVPKMLNSMNEALKTLVENK